jgi:hypothetical protein
VRSSRLTGTIARITGVSINNLIHPEGLKESIMSNDNSYAASESISGGFSQSHAILDPRQFYVDGEYVQCGKKWNCLRDASSQD